MVYDMNMKPKKAKRNVEPLTPEDIRRIRESLGLSQIEAGELLGGGIRAFQKYESGSVAPAATTVNLLRILEVDPTALGTLTGKSVPIQQAGLKPFEVSGAHITALTDRFLVVLTRRLLSAEAARHRIPPDRIHVASNLTAADGGEDARIIWEGALDRTAFLPSRNCLLQVKAASITPQKAAKDVLTTAGDLEPAIRETLEAGGTYVMLCNRPYVNKEIVRREAAIREAIREQGVNIKAGQVVFRDADQVASWVNDHPQVATWVQEQTQPGLATTFRTWNHWAGRHEHEMPFIDDARLEAVKAGVRPGIENEREVVRIVGLSGLGKSRLVLEALANDDDAGTCTGDLVLYGVETELGPASVKQAVQFLADIAVRAVVVVDRCSEETHVDLAAMVRRSSSRLSLITIDHEVPGGTLPPGTLLVERASNAVVELLIKSLQPGLPSEDVRRLVSFSNGFPQMAVLSAQAWVADVSLASVTKDFLIDQVVVGRRAANRQETLQSAKILSVFGVLGFRDEEEKQLEYAAEFAGGLAVDQLRAYLTDLVRRRVAQPRGRLLAIQPRPIAYRLAERQWEEWGRDVWDRILTQSPLRALAARQLALLNRSDISLEVARHVCRQGGPLDSFELINDPINAGVIDSLAQIDSKVVGSLLERNFEALNPGDLQALESSARSEIRWAAQRIAFVPETFELGARLLLQLALAETERWDNNCTGQFKALFPVYLGDTAADGAARLSLLDSLIAENAPGSGKLLVGALEHGAKIQYFSRAVGTESHGLRRALQSWNPDNSDAVAYVKECLSRLLLFALQGGETGTLAKQVLAGDMRALVASGFIDFVEEAVTKVTYAQGAFWPLALSSLGDIITFDSEEAPPELIVRVRAMIERVSPTNLNERFKLLVTEMPWDYPCDEKLDFSEREVRQRKAIEELAQEALQTPEALKAALPGLSAGEQRMAGLFGTALAQFANDKLGWLWPVLNAYGEASLEVRNPDLATSYLAELAKTKPRLVGTFKRRAMRSPSLSRMVPLVAFKMGLSSSDILLARDGLRSEKLQGRALYPWTFGGRLAKLEPEEVAPLFDQIFSSGENANFGYDLMGMYVHGRRERLEQLRPQLRLAAESASATPSATMNDHHFNEMMTWLLRHGRNDSDARAVALTLTRQLIGQTGRDSLPDEGKLRPLLPLLLREFPEIVWPLIGNAIISDRKVAWRFQHSLGKGFSFGSSRHQAPIMELSEDTLFAWSHAHPEIAPAFLAAALPLLTTDDSGTEDRAFLPIVRKLMDEFGEREDVQRALVSNMYTFGWAGSITTYYQLYRKPLESLHDHSKAGVRRWGRKMSDQLERQIAQERDTDEERDAQYD
jgi:DNA-binding transcriptional regulator YiaG